MAPHLCNYYKTIMIGWSFVYFEGTWSQFVCSVPNSSVAVSILLSKPAV